MRHLWKLSFLLLALPLIADAETAKTLKQLVSMIVKIINSAIVTLVGVALVVFLYGAVIQTYKAGERGSKVLSTYLIWGITILFVMVSIWGIIALLQQTLFGGDFAPTGAAQTGVGNMTNPY